MKWLTVILLLPACWFRSGPSLKAQEAPQPPVIQFASDSYTVNESAGTVDLTVTLSNSAANAVTVNYATSDGTAVAGTDYTAASGTLTFNPGVTSQTISIGILDNDNYSNQSVYFTAALSQPSSNATLGTPSTTTVNVLDNDLAPVADIEIQGVPPDKPGQSPKNNPGGFVVVNANNDNGYGYPLTYSDGVTEVPPGGYGIPQKRDFDLTLFESADPDLLEIDLQAQNLKPGGPEKIVLSVSSAGQAQVAIWEDNTKNISIQTPTNWTKVAMPASVYVEGLVEGDDLRQVTLTLQILNNGNVVSTDTCTLTVTPVLTNLEVKAAQGAAPNLALDKQLGLILDSGAGGAGQTFTANALAQWNAVRGALRFVQNVKNVNNLGGWGATLGPPPAAAYKWDYGGTYVGQTLVDGSKVPFYTANENPSMTADFEASNSVTDSPALALNRVTNVLPGVGNTTTIDVTYSYVTYATIAFDDGSLYFLGQQPWSVRFTGAMTQPQNNKYTFTPAKGDVNTPSGRFVAGVRNNANPVSIGPVYGNSAQAALGWR